MGGRGRRKRRIRVKNPTVCVEYKPARCFFVGSKQHENFCKLVIQNDTAFQGLLTKIAIFHINTKQVGDVMEFEIHENAKEPLY